ncbi:response regulator [Pseudomaricurvus sp.]|uniref:response regulator n=1 Tax=Pseudomaricurvus sp. TaxID=2004510 RepID=UPI003F6BED09
MHEGESIEHHRSELAIRWLESLTQHSVATNNTKHITETFGDLMELPNVRGVYLYDPQGQISIKQGQRADASIVPQLTDTPHHWQQDDNNYYSVPVFNRQDLNNIVQLGWVVLAVNKHALNIRHYQNAAIILFSILITSIVLMILAWRLTRSIEVPLHNAQRTLQDFNRHKFESRTAVSGSIELQNLAHGLNELGKGLQQSQNNIRQQVDQATSDLQETLETVEIQSIELDIARKNAVAANRAKSEFLANTTHEIRTPINGILGFTNLLLKSPLTTQQREYLRTIAHSSHGLLTIINDILDFSRLEEDELSLDHTPFTLRQVIEETLQILAPGASEKQLYLIATSAPDVPQQLLGDALRLKQILINLVSNSIKFSDSGDIVVRSNLIENSDRSAYIKISVQDSGIGIDPKQRDQLFEPFKQADASDSRLKGGTGLGLAIAKGLVEKMGGAIHIDSKPDAGTTVWFTLPLSKQQTLIESRQTKLQGKRALVHVENPQIKQQLEEYFSLWGVESQNFNGPEDLRSYYCAQKADDTQNTPAIDFVFVMTREGAVSSEDLNLLNKNDAVPPVIVAVLPDSPMAYDETLHNTGADLLFLPLSYEHLYQVLCDTLRPTTALPSKPARHTAASVLVVDDNSANLQLVSTFLSSLGVAVHEATSGAEAITVMDNHSINLVFMDVQMPEMDGIETTRRIRNSEHSSQHVPIIALTAHNINEQKTKILEAGMDDCISKPVSEEQLIHSLKQWLHISPGASPDANESIANLISKAHVPQSAIMNLQEALHLCNGKNDLARDMLGKLSEGLAEDSELISQLYQQKNWGELQERVHRLYGGCCYCGVPELRKATATLDNLLIKGEHTHLDAELNRVLKAIQRLREWVDEHDLDIIFDIETAE